ncbi:MAG: DUF4258 domain-containing protein [Candidatus Thiosymbion ectosymbiont of Robbea hypermnestra]|nr:DUF4258 domain-containing protein [Candidatus Thiosymbion ectosymbiont of Robbea hypermnestra]
MSDVPIHSLEAIVARLRQQAEEELMRITVHAHQEMVEEHISLDDVVSVLLQATVVENYPEHRRGACCLVCGQNRTGRYLHVVCTTALDPAIIITVYEPKLPKWVDPFTRGQR